MCQAHPLPSRSLKVTGVKVVKIIRTTTNYDKELVFKGIVTFFFAKTKEVFWQLTCLVKNDFHEIM